jgi:hypothetical protein
MRDDAPLQLPAASAGAGAALDVRREVQRRAAGSLSAQVKGSLLLGVTPYALFAGLAFLHDALRVVVDAGSLARAATSFAAFAITGGIALALIRSLPPPD